MRRLFTISAALSAVILVLSTLMWVRGFFASDVWASHLYTPSARLLDSRSIEVSNGWLFIVRSTTLMPPGVAPQPPPPVDSTWIYGAGPPNIPSRQARRGSIEM